MEQYDVYKNVNKKMISTHYFYNYIIDSLTFIQQRENNPQEMT